jgi:simple sugar transport system permease protein
MKPDRMASLLAALAGIAAAWIAFDLLVWGYGESPREILGILFAGTWGTAYGAGQVLFKATPLLFTGVAVDLALRGGLFNIGAEGQLTIASLVAATVGAHLPAGMPAPLAIVVVVALASAAGAAWASVPAILRARLAVHEVISTIMMNRIGDALVGFALAAGLAITGTVRTPDVIAGARLPRLDALAQSLRGSAASFALFIAVAIAVAVPWAARRTRVLREVTLVGLNPEACAAERIPVARRVAQAMLLSGAIAGLGSTATVLGYKGYFESGLGAGAGFGGIAVAMLGRGNAIGLVLAALLFGTLQQGGLAVNAHVPMEVMDVLQGVIVIAVALADARVRDAIGRAVRVVQKGVA